MPYNPQLQATIIVSKDSHSMLKQMATKNRRTLQGELELIIGAEYKRNDLQDSDVQSEVSGDSKAQPEAQRKDNL